MDILDATNKQPSTRKYDKDKLVDKTGKSENKTKKFHKKNSKFKGNKRNRSDFDSDDKRRDKYCVICNAKGEPF